ncbi:YdiU family protein [Xenophilus sp. Marseille-Q4582]|uniref:protein adenylyltransferase SelO n=1 Tax=Xenophilus sp. Marseille-Q4582 TaxID=2866600 RepID=UPI001CE3F9D5|nr:YdiU family protein [Xenophilus sp. Marseille-Q4582]
MSEIAEKAPIVDLGLPWKPGFRTLGPAFFTVLRPTPLPAPHWVAHSEAASRALGLPADWHNDASLAAFTGNAAIAGTEPLATVYSGHQFGVWAGQLGDGRAILLGETAGGLEVQLKGAGRTPYSRMGDGRAVLRSSIREFLCSEAMHALGVPTTRALCVTGSPQPVRRETLETAAVVTRLAPSFIRFGHFEHFAAAGREDELRRLADFVIDRFYPACRTDSRLGGNAYASLLQAVSERTAEMVAHWQAIGFCHGVMNTDNMSILGLTIDYGPFQFLDGFDPGHICNHSDTGGRYAFNQQPNVAYWNLFCLAQALMPLIGEEELALAALGAYRDRFPLAFDAHMRAKLALADARAGDGALVERLLRLLAAERTDWTIFWRRFAHWRAGAALAPVRELFVDARPFDEWLLSFETRAAQDCGHPASALATNPAYVLRNHLAQVAIEQAQQTDFSGVQTLLTLLQTPYQEQPGMQAYADFPPDWASTIEISCSS